MFGGLSYFSTVDAGNVKKKVFIVENLLTIIIVFHEVKTFRNGFDELMFENSFSAMIKL